MKKFILITIASIMLIGLVYGAGKVKIVQSSKTFVSAGQTDTSSTFDLEYYPEAELAWSYYGTDSIAKSYVYIDGYVNGKWQLAMATDSTWLNESAVSGGKGVLLRGFTANKIPGAEAIRIRTVTGAIGGNDSLGALYYKQSIILRNSK
jgi:hypothetical protein